MKLFEAAKSVSLAMVLTEMCNGVLPERRKNHLTSCPICGGGQKTPCFGLYGKNKNILDKFKCFSCGAQGDNVTLVKAFYGLATDVDAAKEICTYFHIEYEDTTSTPPSKEYTDYTSAYNYVAKFFHNCYNSSFNPDSHYFKNRGLGDSIVEEYQLGYCPSSFLLRDGKQVSLKDILTKAGVAIPDGLCNSFGECIFSDRYIFPIRNTKGDVIGLSGRSLNPNCPKYINSPETDFFKKSFVLFNYNKAKAYPTIYVVEGYMDALSLVQAGVPNVVAAMGTAFTDSHLDVLKCKNIILSLDHDGAGMGHMLSIIENHKNIYFRVLYTPEEYKDFNEMLMAKADIKAFLSNYNFKTGVEFMIRLLTHTMDMSRLEVRSEIWKRIATMIGSNSREYRATYPINTLYTPVEFSFYWKLYQKFLKKNRKEVK